MPDYQRFRATLSYQGTTFSGWQRQPNAKSIQETIETALSTLLQFDVQLVGCGRTDAAVHAKNYVAHYDLPTDQKSNLEDTAYKLNRMLPPAIVVHRIDKVAQDFHARFSAVSRTYRYYMTGEKDPFNISQIYRFPLLHKMDPAILNSCANLIASYNEFFPFCKSHSDTPHYLCDIHFANWAQEDGLWQFEIKANRFLRGMVRLIVGACLQVSTGKVPLSQIKEALDTQTSLPKPLSAPAAGLYLVAVEY